MVPCCRTGHQEELKVEVTSESKITTNKELSKITGKIINQSNWNSVLVHVVLRKLLEVLNT